MGSREEGEKTPVYPSWPVTSALEVKAQQPEPPLNHPRPISISPLLLIGLSRGSVVGIGCVVALGLGAKPPGVPGGCSQCLILIMMTWAQQMLSPESFNVCCLW